MMSAAKKTHWLRNTIIVLLVCGIAGTLLAAVLFMRHPDRTSAVASLQFSFDGAAEGTAPNGNAFDVDDLTSDEVLETALGAAGLSGSYTPDQIRENLVVTGSYPENLVEQVMSYESLMSFTANRELMVNEYHPTLFSVALYNDFDKAIPQAKLEELLQAVMDSFQARFAQTATVSLDWGEDGIYALDKYDYPQQLEVLQETMTQQARYAEEMYDRKPTFVRDGKGFNDIYVRFNSLIESDIQRLNATITMNALTRNTARLLTQYQFEIRDLNNQLTKQTEELERLDALIASYEKNEIIYLSTTESLTKIDGNSSETYDELVTARKKASDDITEINSKITTYQLKLADLMKDSAGQTATASTSAGDDAEAASTETMKVEQIQELTEEEIAAAAAAAEEAAKQQTATLEKGIESLVEKSNAVSADFKALLDAYNDQEVNDQTVRVFNRKYITPKLVSGAFIKKVIKTAGPFCAVGFMICMVLLIASRRKEEKRASRAR
ncbi:MAG: hypothetical protein IJH09_04800 [Clostridia bacterium]|nr:hypothetical protein [Clostridia bacterium]